MITCLTRKAAAASPAALIALLIAGAAGCGDTLSDPEAAVRAWVAQGVERAEAKDRRALVDMISASYTDARGNKRDDIENMFRIYFLRQHTVALLTRIEALEVHDESAAELTLAVGMAGTNDGVLGFSADAYRFEMELERDEPGSIRHEPMEPGEVRLHDVDDVVAHGVRRDREPGQRARR
jgi:hypothetical protein